MFFLNKAKETVPAGKRWASTANLLVWSAGLGLFILSLLAGLYLTFPAASLQRRLSNEVASRTPLEISLQGLSLRPLLTLQGEQLDIRFDNLPDYTLRLEKILLDPWWSRLLRGTPGIEGRSQLLGGEFSFQAQSSGPVFITAQDLQLDIPLAGAASLRFKASLTNALLHTAIPLQKATVSLVEAELNAIEIEGLDLFLAEGARLNLGLLHFKLSGRGTAFKLENCIVSGGDIEATGRGTLLLANILQNSRINLTLSVRASAQAQRGINGLLALAGPPQADGNHILLLTGTLGNPLLRSKSAPENN